MHNPAHPGEVLREYLPEGVSIGEVAKRLGVTRQALSALLTVERSCRRQRIDGPAPRGSAWDQRRNVAQHADKLRPLACAQATATSAANVRINQGGLRASRRVAQQAVRLLIPPRCTRGAGRTGGDQKTRTCVGVGFERPDQTVRSAITTDLGSASTTSASNRRPL